MRRPGLLRLFLAVTAALTAGCSTFDIHKGTGRVAGVPFYAKVGKLKQTTTYSRTWMELEFTVADVAGGTKSNVQTALLRVDERTLDAATFNTGMAAATQALRNNRTLEQIVQAFTQAAPTIIAIPTTTIVTDSAINTATPTALLQTLISNGTELVTEVDYATTYYYDVNTPIFGAADASIKLAPDASLSEAAASVDATKLAEEIPLAELLAKSLGITLAAVPATTPNRELSAGVTRRGYLYTLTKLHDPLQPRRQNPLTFGSEDSILRTPLDADTAKKEPTGREATFQGSVSLPKP